jgi:hypothetical protein
MRTGGLTPNAVDLRHDSAEKAGFTAEDAENAEKNQERKDSSGRHKDYQERNQRMVQSLWPSLLRVLRVLCGESSSLMSTALGVSRRFFVSGSTGD